MRIIVDNVTLDLDDKICKAFENRLYPVSAEECKMYITEEYHMPVMDAVKNSDCEFLTIRYDGQLLFYGRRENFLAGIENSLQYRRLARRYILSTEFDGDVLQLQVDLTSKEC